MIVMDLMANKSGISIVQIENYADRIYRENVKSNMSLIASSYTESKLVNNNNNNNSYRKPATAPARLGFPLLSPEQILCRKCLAMHTDFCNNCRPGTAQVSTQSRLTPLDLHTRLVINESRLTKKHNPSPVNQHYFKEELMFNRSTYDTNISVVSLIVKEKCNSIASSSTEDNYVDFRYLATPFATSYNNDEDFLYKRKKKMLEEQSKLRQSKPKGSPSDYYFANLMHLQKKYVNLKPEEKLKLSKIKVPETSNDLFNQIERFDIAENYKVNNVKVSPLVNDVIQTNREVLNDLNKKNSHSSIKFVSMKKFKPPQFASRFVKPFEPPLTKIANQKFITLDYVRS